MSKKKTPEVPAKKPLTEAELAVKHNQKEVLNQLNAHFNGNAKEQKNALKNVDTVFDNLVKANKKANS